MELQMKRCIFSLGVIFALAGCAQIDFAKKAGQEAINKAADRTYGLQCNTRYKTEALFRARHAISKKTFNEWCKR